MELKFKNIPQFTRTGNYRVNIPWSYLEEHLRHLHNPASGEKLDMDPDFQRGNVWTEDQQIKYVEFVLRGGVSGNVIYWNNPSWMRGFNKPTVLVDGKQRLTAALKFLQNEIPVFGHFRKEYTDKLSSDIQFIFIINDLRTRREVLQWYLDLNAGGTVHTADEINKVKKMLETC